MYYSISDGKDEKGYGFAPVKSELIGPGRIVENEQDVYVRPLYSRTMEISKEQHAALEKHGEESKKGTGDFNMEYHFLSNSCVDFVWKGLAKANIYRTSVDKQGNRENDTDYEGSLLPTRNMDDIRSIQAPLKNSPHNKETFNGWPKQNLGHHLLSEENTRSSPEQDMSGALVQQPQNAEPAGPFNDPVLDKAFAAMMDGDSDQLDRIAAEFSQSSERRQMHQLGDSLLADHHRQQQLAQQDSFTR